MAVPCCPGCCERDVRIAQLESRLAELEAKVREQAHLILDLARKLQDQDLPKSGTPGQPGDAAKPPPRQASRRKEEKKKKTKRGRSSFLDRFSRKRRAEKELRPLFFSN